MCGIYKGPYNISNIAHLISPLIYYFDNKFKLHDWIWEVYSRISGMNFYLQLS
jgi:hypothetical protein